MTGYHVSPAHRDTRLDTPAHAEVLHDGSGSATSKADQIPPEMRRELARRPIITQSAPVPPAGSKPAGGNPFGLD